MAERYTRLYSLPENQYTVGSPILIAAGALLKDNQTGKALAQVKFRNISEKQIKALKVSVAAFDVSGKELEGVAEYQYLDLTAARTAEFGHKQAVTLPNANTRSFEVKCTAVFFTDGAVWNAAPDAVWSSLPMQKTVTAQLGDLAAQYQRDTSPRSKFIPVEHKDLWLCSCGAINHDGEPMCHNCRHSKGALFATLDIDTLQQRDAEYKAAEAEKAEKQAAADKVQRAKTTKFTITAAAVIVVITSVFLLTTKVVIPNSKYNNAVALMDAGKYEDAISAFEALDGSKDSADRIVECETAILDGKYHDAVALMEAGKYKDAISAFDVLKGHRDSTDKITECQTLIWDGQYAEAVALRESGNLYAAVKKFITIEQYKDAAEHIQQLWGKLAGRTSIIANTNISIGINNSGKWNANGEYGVAKDILKRNDIISIAVSNGFTSEHAIGLCADGTVVAVGDDDHGQCDVKYWNDIVAIDTCEYMTVGLKKDGTVVATGYEKKSAGYTYDAGQCKEVSNWRDIVAIAVNARMVAGVKSDGTVVLAGFYPKSVLDWTDIVAIDVGSWHIVGLKADGTVVAETLTLSFASGNTYGQYGQCDGIENWTDIVAISAEGNCTIGLKSNGTVVATGENAYGQCNVSGWKNIVAISTSGNHTIALKADGTVVAVGFNKFGQCDVSNWKNIKVPN